MHELSLAVEIVDQAVEVMRREQATELLAVEVVVGALSGVEREPLEFAFTVTTENGPARGARLVVEERAVRVRCRTCGRESRPELPRIGCAACGGDEVELLEGQEFYIKAIEVK